MLTDDQDVPSTRLSTVGDRAFPVAAARTWNSLPAANLQNQTKISFILDVVSVIPKLLYVRKVSELLRHFFTLNLM